MGYLIQLFVEGDMNQVILVTGMISLIVGCIMVYYYFRSKRIIDEMWAVKTYGARELRMMCSSGFNAVVEVEGIVECDHPLITPAAKIPCCWYHIKIEREMYGSKGSTHWISAFEDTKSTIFKVCDKTGFTLIEPMRAEVDAACVYFDTAFRDTVYEINNNISLSDTGQYRITEEALHDGGYVYVLGTAQCIQQGSSSDVVIRKSEQGYIDQKGHFIISRKSEKELTKQYGLSVSICYYLAAISFAVVFFCILCITGIIKTGGV